MPDFAVGEMVIWTKFAKNPKLLKLYKKENGEGPFTIEKITSAVDELTAGVDYGTIHPQTVYFRNQNGELRWLGGSWFNKLAE
jgi:hypothetical protein